MLLCLSCVLCLMAHNAVYDDKSRNPKRERSAMIGQLLLRGGLLQTVTCEYFMFFFVMYDKARYLKKSPWSLAKL